MSITAKIIKDSINSKTNDRLTTFVITYPRFVHAEFMTHRMLSKNSASTRAIPTNKIIQAIIDDPAMPVFWGKNQSGMQAKEELDDSDQKYRSWYELDNKNFEINASHYQTWLDSKSFAKTLWLAARNSAISISKTLVEIGLHKQIAGRILEPWFNITVLVSGTEWENFFALRAHEDAQPEIRALAELMLEEYNKSIPEIKEPIINSAPFYLCEDSKNNYFLERIENENWHIPFEDKMPEGLSKADQLKVAIARCARLSYITFDGEINVEKDFDIYNKLTSGVLHASPFEHVAYPINESKFIGNFKGWCQYRKLLPNENQRDNRVIKRQVVNGVVI